MYNFRGISQRIVDWYIFLDSGSGSDKAKAY